MKSNLLNFTRTALLGSAMVLSVPAFADGDHGHGNGGMGGGMMSGSGHMMDSSEMGEHMKMVMGHGRINKVMGNRHMMNISHEPIAELNWPKMRMNFKVDDSIDMSSLKPGQEVNFTLQVDKENNYLIKKVEPK